MDSTPDVYALIEPKTVDVAAIERELEQIWRDSSSAPGEESAIARISLLNLVACTEDTGRAADVARQIAAVTVYHPCRAIIVAIGPESAPSDLEASVTAYCHLPETGPKPVCCEQITIRTQGEAVNRLPAVLPPLFVPDLPRFLWWLDAPDFERDLFRRLAEEFDRLILDSKHFREKADLLRLIQWHGEILVSDLNWTRLNAWQELTAEFFDPVLFRPYLSRIEQINIEYTPCEGVCEAQALLFTGWLAARLSWEPQSVSQESDGMLIRLSSRGRPVSVRLHLTSNESTPPGEMASVRIEAGGMPPASFEIRRVEDGSLARVSVEMEGACPLPRRVSLSSQAIPLLLCEDLESLGRNPLFEEALHKIVDILKSLARIIHELVK